MEDNDKIIQPKPIKSTLRLHRPERKIFYSINKKFINYGAIYNVSMYNRNIITNVLDSSVKGIFGISLASYLILHK